MEYPNPVTITNWSPVANAYRNLRRPEVDAIFLKAEKLETKSRYDKKLSKSQKSQNQQKVESLRNEAKQLWRRIITHANTLNN